MKLAEGIRKHGFRKWYERELLTGHAHLALLLFCVIGLMMALEAASRFKAVLDQVIDLVAAVVCAAAGLWALRRYLYVVGHAESIAHQAECPACKTYGRLELLRANASGDEVVVRCRHCRHEWQIDG
jgi:DNA-directed RNA polymerase subunit M/transcription elongation factor TFIIS